MKENVFTLSKPGLLSDTLMETATKKGAQIIEHGLKKISSQVVKKDSVILLENTSTKAFQFN